MIREHASEIEKSVREARRLVMVSETMLAPSDTGYRELRRAQLALESLIEKIGTQPASDRTPSLFEEGGFADATAKNA